jgi:uncharacterized cofD-like protein
VQLALDPAAPPAAPGVVQAIRRADIIVLGPGSLYSSILPNLLLPEVAAALRETRAFRVMALNAMTELGETTGCNAADHVRAIVEHVGEEVVDAVLVATDKIPVETLERYVAEGAAPVEVDDGELARLVPLVVRASLLQVSPIVRHDPVKTAGAVLSAFAAWRKGAVRSGPAPSGAGRPVGAGGKR